MSVYNVIKRGLYTSQFIKTIKNVTIIGGGSKGSGIAQIAAQTGHVVTLVEINPDILKTAQEDISKNLELAAKKLYENDGNLANKFINDTQLRIRSSVNPADSVYDADLVIEAVVEDIAVKHNLFKGLDEAAPEKTIFTSITSFLSIEKIASITERKDRFGGLHFVNPVPETKLLEVVRTPETSHETYDALMNFGTTIGKTCITSKDTPGFVLNRLMLPYVAEAIRMMERGDASAKDIDTAMKLGGSFPMGPFELADHVGHDTIYAIIDILNQQSPENPLFYPLKTQKKLINEGKLGIKSGEGYYKYNNLQYWVNNFTKTLKKENWAMAYKSWKRNLDNKINNMINY